MAKEFFTKLKVTDLLTRWDLLSASYPWLARAGKRAEAVAAARQVIELSKQLFGDDDPRVEMAMHDLAFYTRRLDRDAGIRAYRELLNIRLRRWGDASHPVVASQMKDLGASLLSMGDETSVREAVSLLETAYSSLLRSTGPEGKDTAVAESLLALSLVSLIPFLSESEASPVTTRALKLAEEALRWRKAVRPQSQHLAQRANVAYARLANGDLSSFDELEDILAYRVRRYEDPLRVAEVRWQATRMADAYRQHGRHQRSLELVADFRLDEPDSKWLT
jgi:hypothetical protein